jgi:hypothetical protein
MAVSHHSDDQAHTREEGLLTLSILAFVIATFLMGWYLRDHERPNMPRPIAMKDAGTPR